MFTDAQEQERNHRLSRYADYDDFTFAHTDCTQEFPRGPVQIVVRGRTCGTIEMDWETVVDVLSETFNRREWDRSVDEKKRLATMAANAAVFHVLEFLPEKIDRALEQLCGEAFIGLLKRRSVLRRVDLSLAQEVESIVRAEEKAIKARLNIRTGPVPEFLDRDHYESVLLEAIAQLQSSGKAITQELVAEQLAETRSTTINDRMIRRWNNEYGVDWETFIRPFENRTNSI